MSDHDHQLADLARELGKARKAEKDAHAFAAELQMKLMQTQAEKAALQEYSNGNATEAVRACQQLVTLTHQRDELAKAARETREALKFADDVTVEDMLRHSVIQANRRRQQATKLATLQQAHARVIADRDGMLQEDDRQRLRAERLTRELADRDRRLAALTRERDEAQQERDLARYELSQFQRINETAQEGFNVLLVRAEAAEGQIAAALRAAVNLQSHLGWNDGSDREQIQTQRLCSELVALLDRAEVPNTSTPEKLPQCPDCGLTGSHESVRNQCKDCLTSWLGSGHTCPRCGSKRCYISARTISTSDAKTRSMIP